MTQLPKISLNEKWRYRYSTEYEDYSSPIINESDWDWTVFTEIPISKVSPPDVVWLRKRFDLSPTDACVRYYLRCKDSAYPMTVYLRGQEIIHSGNDSHLDIDVTDYLSLDDNCLVLAIQADQWDLDPQQAEIYLQPIFCDDLE